MKRYEIAIMVRLLSPPNRMIQKMRMDFVSSTLLEGRDSVIVWKLVNLLRGARSGNAGIV